MILFLFSYWRWFLLGAGALFVVWYIKHVETVSYRQGATDRETSALQEAAAKVEKDTAARKADLDQRETDLDMLEAKTQGERAALNTARAGINSALSQGLSQLATQGIDTRNELKTVPDDALFARFRLSLQRADVADRERAASTVK